MGQHARKTSPGEHQCCKLILSYCYNGVVDVQATRELLDGRSKQASLLFKDAIARVTTERPDVCRPCYML